MSSSNRKKYILPDGSIAIFNRTNFKKALLQKKLQLENSYIKHSQQAILEDIAEATGISFCTLKYWSTGHNSPADLETIKALAENLNVEIGYLLENELDNSFDTDNRINIIKADNINYDNVKNLIRNIYIDMVDYIEMFREAGAGIIEVDTEKLRDTFVKIHRSLLYTRFDLPKEIFDKLCSFSVNYLQQLGSYLNYTIAIYQGEFPDNLLLNTPKKYFEAYANAYYCPTCAPWGDCLIFPMDYDSAGFNLFKNAIIRQYEIDTINDLAPFSNKILIDTAYSRIEAILKDYLIN